ncbi:hypothetical protein B0H11DRAFT_2027937 [Mycena galericulata]|nr:hypothetical protein B0H11DRAFT_2027937 [Mycena galericulata]
MIITDDSPQSPIKASTPLLTGASGSGVPPPAYVPREAGPTPIGAAQARYPVYEPVYPQPRQSAARRFFLAFLTAFGIWLLVSALLGSIFDHSVVGGGSDRWEYPAPPDVISNDCATAWLGGEKRNSPFRSFPYSVEASLDVPLPRETLLLLSEGSLSAGNLKITTSQAVTGIARVHITVHYYQQDVRDKARICLIDRKDGERGVGIFTPKYWRNPSRTDRLYFEVVLTLPQGFPTLYLNRLATDVNNFSHDLDSLKDIIHFGEISLKGSNGKISAQTLGAENATLTTSNAVVSADYLVAPSIAVRTSNGGISGSFNAVDSIVLRTSNGPINVQVALDVGDSKETKSITMSTTNDRLESNVALFTSTGTGGIFLVKADTINGRLKTVVSSAPLDSVLNVAATTSNSQASLQLPSTYEGGFELHTSNAVPSIKRLNPYEPDPAHKRRTRHVETEEVAGSIEHLRRRIAILERQMALDQDPVSAAETFKKGKTTGVAYWDKKNEHRGAATLTSSNGPVTLYI